MSGSRNEENLRNGEVRQMTLFSMADQDKTFNALCDSLGCENNTPGWPDQFGRAISAWLAENKVAPIKTLSLFSGAGGLDIGFSDVGFDIAASVEIERKVCDTLELNTGKGKYFEHSKVNCVDVRAFTGDGLGPIDFIIGGPPCQTFSAAGRRANGVLGTADARGNLFREYVRLLKTLSPKGFLFENVYGIVGAQNGKAWKEILQAFSAVGYQLFYRILDAADYGVPQHRERLLIVGLKEGVFQFPRPTHGPDSVDQEPFYNAATAVSGVDGKQPQEQNRLKGRYAALLDSIPPGLNYSFYTEEMGHPTPIFAWRSKFSDFLYKADPNEPVRTIKASGGAYTGPFHWENRFFSYEEYKRLQTFPDSYQISGSKKIAVQQIGNSVPPQLARILALAIRQQVFGTKFPFALPLLADNEELSFRKRKRELAKAYREKAELAIKDIRQQSEAAPRSRTYFCTIDSTFRFRETNRDEADYQVAVSWGGNLRIELQDLKKPAPIAASMQITPADRMWALEAGQVELIVRAALKPGFTAAWKAFEQELIANGIKADLVQLNGYYQYPPKLRIDAQIFEEGQYARVLESVLRYHGVPEILTGRQLAEKWQISEQELIPAAEFLKDLGYEIRNHCTNSQIEQGSWLIPYAFPTLTPLSVQLWKKLKESEAPNMPNNHLDVYEDRCELHQDDRTMVFYQGFQNEAAQQRYALIQQTLKDGYLEQVIASVPTKDVSELSEENRALLRTMVDGITSEVGRALVGLVCLQLTIKSIAPEQSVRLHKGSTIRGRFSWVDGISMRSLDKNYNTPFLRKHGLLNVNRDGVFMTRSLAENYPYSTLYKAEMKKSIPSVDRNC